MKKNKSQDILSIFILIGVVIGIFWFTSSRFTSTKSEFDYMEWTEKITSNEVKTIVISPVGDENVGVYKITGEYSKDGETVKYEVIVPTEAQLDKAIDIVDDNDLDITINTEPKSTSSFLSVLSFILPFIFMIAIFMFFRNAAQSGGGAGGVARSRAKLHAGKGVTFDNVAGLNEEKEEIDELIDFMKNPSKYKDMGARIPKGVLLKGPPGTGKTLLAKAVAGESGVPFYFMSGSEFLEMFVGVGAARVRDMFKVAKQNAPCVLFIDEIDAVGRRRGTGMGGGNDEREQTLNQLLVEMDGFGENSGVIVIAATNRPDVLDPALLRAGRFDRQITVGLPDVTAREEILAVHSKNKKIDSSVSLNDIAKRTPRFSGADLENVLNEASLLAARNNNTTISLQDIDEAVDRVMMGPAKKSKVKRDTDELKTTAIHEAGHAVIGVKLGDADIVHKVTIIPRGDALGYAIMMPEEERYNETKTSLEHKISGLLGGRTAEEVINGEPTTGASNDFMKATNIARAMVTEFGMSPLGPIQYEQRQGSQYLGGGEKVKQYSEAMSEKIDAEVKAIVTRCHDVATKIIKENIDLVHKIANYLLEIETLTKDDIYEIVDTGSIKWWEDKK